MPPEARDRLPGRGAVELPLGYGVRHGPLPGEGSAARNPALAKRAEWREQLKGHGGSTPGPLPSWGPPTPLRDTDLIVRVIFPLPLPHLDLCSFDCEIASKSLSDDSFVCLVGLIFFVDMISESLIVVEVCALREKGCCFVVTFDVRFDGDIETSSGSYGWWFLYFLLFASSFFFICEILLRSYGVEFSNGVLAKRMPLLLCVGSKIRCRTYYCILN